jgi:hypothetical protein
MLVFVLPTVCVCEVVLLSAARKLEVEKQDLESRCTDLEAQIQRCAPRVVGGGMLSLRRFACVTDS